MRKMLLFLCCNYCLFFACTKTDLPSKEVVPTQPVAQHYILKSISFQPDTIKPPVSEIKTSALTSLTYINGISTKGLAIYQPEILESSYFRPTGSLDSLLKTQDTTYLFVPAGIDSNNDFVPGSQKWALSAEYISRPAASVQIKDTVEVPPHTTLAVTGTLTYKVITAAYTVSFQGEKDRSILKYEGLWEGVVPIKTTLHFESKKNN